MATVYILMWKRQSWPLSNPMLGAATAMFIISTVHLSIDLRRILNGFILSNGGAGPEAYFSNIKDPLFTSKSILYYIQTLIGDSFVVYRLGVVWTGKRKRVVLPALLLLAGSIVAGIGALIAFARASATADVFQAKVWIASYFTLTLCVNFGCTCLIAGRIWSINRENRGSGSRNLLPVVIIIVESGAIYSVSLIALLVVFLAGSWFQYAIMDAVTPIIAIVFTLIIVRIGLGLTNDESRQSRVTPLTSNSRLPPPQPISVQMTRVVHREPGNDASPTTMSFPGDELDRKRGERDDYEPSFAV